MQLEWPRSGIVVVTITGRGVAEFAVPCVRRLGDQLQTSDRVTLLCDFWDMPTYDTAFRVAITDWSAQHEARLNPVHLLTRSPIVSMSMAVANITLRGMFKVHTSCSTYDSAVRHLRLPTKPQARRGQR